MWYSLTYIWGCVSTLSIYNVDPTEPHRPQAEPALRYLGAYPQSLYIRAKSAYDFAIRMLRCVDRRRKQKACNYIKLNVIKCFETRPICMRYETNMATLNVYYEPARAICLDDKQGHGRFGRRLKCTVILWKQPIQRGYNTIYRTAYSNHGFINRMLGLAARMRWIKALIYIYIYIYTVLKIVMRTIENI
jgi:hypothetical protein